MTVRVVDEDSVAPQRQPGDTATTRITLSADDAATELEQRSTRFGQGRSAPRRNAAHDEIGYVAGGTGTLWLEGSPHPLTGDTGVYIAAGERHEIENPGPAELHLVSVMVPARPADGPYGERRVTVPAAEQAVHVTGDRQFRVLVDPGTGCRRVTQFVGFIPPGRAPAHFHPYDELVYVVEGEGIAHVDGTQRLIAVGSCLHLPAGVPHCLENDSSRTMRVLGVFHPAGSPGAKTTSAVGTPASSTPGGH